MINLNNLGLIKQFISQYWIETSFTMKENSFTLPIDIFPHPISHKVFIKKKIDIKIKKVHKRPKKKDIT